MVNPSATLKPVRSGQGSRLSAGMRRGHVQNPIVISKEKEEA